MNSEVAEPSNKSEVLPDKIIGIREKLGYAVGDTASVLYFHTFSQFLVIFYTDVFGLTAAAVGTMMLVTRLFDAFNDPMMGVIADRTETRWGKFRPWLVWGLLPYMVLGILTFTVPDFSEGGKLIYAYITYIGVSVIYTVVNIPYGALMGVMTPHSKERTALASFRFYGAYVAVFFVNLSLLNFVEYFGNGDDAVGFQRTIILYACIAGVLFFTTFATTRERIKPPAGQVSDLKKDFKQLLQNKPWLAICGIGILTLIWVTLRNTAVVYYMKYYVGSDATMTSFFLTVGTFATLIGVAFTGLSERFLGGKKWAYIILTIAVAIVTCGFYLGDAYNAEYLIDVNLFPWAGEMKFNITMSPDLQYIFWVHIISSALTGPLMPLFWSMIADTADYAEWKFGRRFTGLIFSAGTFSQKSGWALGGALGGYFLAWYGYEANVEQTPESIEGIKQLMSFVPSAMGVISAGAALFYGINAKLSQQIEYDLAERKKAEGSLEA